MKINSNPSPMLLVEKIDQVIADRCPIFLSASPHKKMASSMKELAKTLFPYAKSDEKKLKWAQGMSLIINAQVDNFPENLFSDYDYLGHFIWENVPDEEKISYCEKIVQLYQEFGVHSEIHFQYIHDFIYGFDWARWVSKHKAADECSLPEKIPGPYDPIFLEYMRERGYEILELIDKNDQKYGKIPKDTNRNPFCFKRTPNYEIKVFNQLAENSSIPCKAWNIHENPCWSKDFETVRLEVADSMGAQ